MIPQSPSIRFRTRRFAGTLPVLVVLSLILASCGQSRKDLVVLTKTLKRETTASTAVPLEFGTFAAASSTSFWVEGKVQNTGDSDARNVLVSFKCGYGNETKVLSAEIDLIPARKTVEFRTRPVESRFELQLKDEDAEIRFSH